jgi:hypothetical protein
MSERNTNRLHMRQPDDLAAGLPQPVFEVAFEIEDPIQWDGSGVQ